MGGVNGQNGIRAGSRSVGLLVRWGVDELCNYWVLRCCLRELPRSLELYAFCVLGAYLSLLLQRDHAHLADLDEVA